MGAVAAFAMTISVFNGDYRMAFLLTVVAIAIDATDGVLARLARVKETTPNFDGARLDDIVDYLTFVFVPALLLYRAGLLPAASISPPAVPSVQGKRRDGFGIGQRVCK